MKTILYWVIFGLGLGIFIWGLVGWTRAFSAGELTAGLSTGTILLGAVGGLIAAFGGVKAIIRLRERKRKK